MEKEVKKLVLLSSIETGHKFRDLLTECLQNETLHHDIAGNLKLKIWDRSRTLYNKDYDVEDITLISRGSTNYSYFKLFIVYRDRNSQRLTTGEIMIDAEDYYTQNIFDEVINNYTNDDFRKEVNDMIFSHDHIFSLLECLCKRETDVLVRSILDDSYKLDDYVFYLKKFRQDRRKDENKTCK